MLTDVEADMRSPSGIRSFQLILDILFLIFCVISYTKLDFREDWEFQLIFCCMNIKLSYHKFQGWPSLV